ncbi:MULTISPECIES: fumarylacetoacetate hydrolase family protein [Acinetobacter]|uniref:fumarylacetoacetate hydrolase family protein n=1 Tax=Acinetobacter TaxID=469 RepID=UPI000C1E1AC0|nr:MULTISPECIES: fumarylacetoacetate hydrolase family protein [Acinetobacter]MCU4707756.1 fumarylacetoacetate hydrolase family protein [Acinetobacter pittii]NUG01961.1 fumarylacetoacetate hydrolase family protein [Acinetobacter oleivorans]PJF03422.1 fumarylacetoacetate hydrolase [Acinetobacter seifertii]PJG71449.1 fumarylacetoacetate hydrolase [Acinetobacter seifertii]
MKFATLDNGTRDGELIFVSRDLTRGKKISHIASSLIIALENWDHLESQLKTEYEQFIQNINSDDSFPFDVHAVLAPLPRSYQFVDGSAFLNHGNIMKAAYNIQNEEPEGIPILIQRQSDDFRSANADYIFPSTKDLCDFEAEFAVAVSDISMGMSKDQIKSRIKLIMILNDVSMRGLLNREIRMGFGFIQAKTATIFAPVAVTPDELGCAWNDEKVELDMIVKRNNELFGHPNGREMDYSFTDLIAHLTYNRNIKAGTIIGSGTVSNKNAKEVGSACLAEAIALEVLESGTAKSEFIQYGDTVEIAVKDQNQQNIFGSILTKFVPIR